MCALQILVDDREKHVIPFFKDYTAPDNISYKITRLTTSDYAIMHEDRILVLIERKTWRDLATSIKDGRSRNLSKLLEARKETNCKVVYLIEGTPIPSSTARYARIPYKNLRARLDHLIFRDDVHVIHTRDKKQTVDRLHELCKNYLSIKPPMIQKKEKEGGGEKLLKRKITKSAESVIYDIWCCVPNITEKTACLFVNNDWHIRDLLLGKIDKKQIFALKYDNGYVIGKRSEKIWKGSRITDANKWVFVKMLCCINGITKPTAEKILDTIQLKDLLEGKVKQKDIGGIQKSEKRKIGKKVASEVMKYFSLDPETSS